LLVSAAAEHFAGHTFYRVQQTAAGPLLLVFIPREHLVGVWDGILDMGKGRRVEAAL
jgi:hypothetical protein